MCVGSVPSISVAGSRPTRRSMANPFLDGGATGDQSSLLKKERPGGARDPHERKRTGGGWFHGMLLFVASFTVMVPLACLIASVDRIVRFYSSATFEMAFGVAFFTALPTAACQLRNDANLDARFGSRRAFQWRAAGSAVVACIACVVLGEIKGYESGLLVCAAFLGVAAWVGNGVTLAVVGVLPSSAFIAQGFGFQLATLGAAIAPASLDWTMTWRVTAVAPLIGFAVKAASEKGSARSSRGTPLLLQAMARLLSLEDVAAQLSAKDASAKRGDAAFRDGLDALPPVVRRMALGLAMSMCASTVIGGTVGYYMDVAIDGYAVSHVLYLTSSAANVASRPCVSLWSACGAPRPPARAVAAFSAVRLLGLALVFACAFGSRSAEPLPAVVAFRVQSSSFPAAPSGDRPV